MSLKYFLAINPGSGLCGSSPTLSGFCWGLLAICLDYSRVSPNLRKPVLTHFGGGVDFLRVRSQNWADPFKGYLAEGSIRGLSCQGLFRLGAGVVEMWSKSRNRGLQELAETIWSSLRRVVRIAEPESLQSQGFQERLLEVIRGLLSFTPHLLAFTRRLWRFVRNLSGFCLVFVLLPRAVRSDGLCRNSCSRALESEWRQPISGSAMYG
jgi:hypothetical protein